VESISKIQDTIKQAIYIKDCARQFDIREEVLIKEVAKRQKNHAANAPQATAVQENAAVEHETTGGAKARPYTFKEERQLLRYLLRHSNDIIEINSNGERIPITVIDYIAGSIEADGIPFQYPLHIQILDEALSCTTDLRTYFLNHPDVEVQNYVFSLVEDRYEKSAMYQRQESDAEKRERLSSEVQTVMFEYRFAIIKRRCSVVKEQIEAATAVGDNEKVDELLTELQTLNQQRRQISAILGGRPGLR
ncbi:MAG: hypothetical protein II109_07375, partial [Paludibacteraceae bacterium]|nr:hypothetical protein [Paludibacteraceae bacterium]